LTLVIRYAETNGIIISQDELSLGVSFFRRGTSVGKLFFIGSTLLALKRLAK
jgi:hypothetical protein